MVPAGEGLFGKGLFGKELVGKELVPPPRVRTRELHRAR
jgi:hypothetical protein